MAIRRSSLHAPPAFIAVLCFVMLCHCLHCLDLLFIGGHSRVPRRVNRVARHFGVLSNDEALEMFNEHDMVLLDVRLPSEQIKLGSLQAKYDIPTVNIPVDFNEWPFNQESFLSRLNILIPDKRLKYVVACSEGIRSKVIAKVLENNAYRSVYDLCEGVIGWREEGYSVVPMPGPEDQFEPTLSQQTM